MRLELAKSFRIRQPAMYSGELMCTSRQYSKPMSRSQRSAMAGLTLIELMISITIGLAILAGLVGVLGTASGNSKTTERSAELVGNGRYALNTMKQELRQVGFLGYTFPDPTPPTTALGSISNECLEGGATGTAFISNVRQGVWGANDSNPFSSNCIPSANYSTTSDVLVVRRVAAQPVTTLVANTLYYRSSYIVGEVFRGTTLPTFNFSTALAPIGVFPIVTYVYYISPFTVSATESPKVPALMRVAIQPNGSMAAEVVASGVERMQIQYGRFLGATGTRYYDTLVGTSVATAATEWDDVSSVRVWLLTRTANAEPGYTDPNAYVMGSQTYTPADSYRRQLLSTVVQVRNSVR